MFNLKIFEGQGDKGRSYRAVEEQFNRWSDENPCEIIQTQLVAREDKGRHYVAFSVVYMPFDALTGPVPAAPT